MKYVKLFESFAKSLNFPSIKEVEKRVIESEDKDAIINLMRESKEIHGKAHSQYFLNEASEEFYSKLEAILTEE